MRPQSAGWPGEKLPTWKQNETNPSDIPSPRGPGIDLIAIQKAMCRRNDRLIGVISRGTDHLANGKTLFADCREVYDAFACLLKTQPRWAWHGGCP